VQPLENRSWLSVARTEDSAEHPERRLTPRLGAVVNYEPQLVLYLSQPFDESIEAIELAVGGPSGNEVVETTGTRVIQSTALNQPVDLAPVEIKTDDLAQPRGQHDRPDASGRRADGGARAYTGR
jgi:hypothetical protein